MNAAAIAWPVVQSPVVSRIDPLQDSRWDHFVATHPRASVFHSSTWLKALSLTYGYRPVALTTSQRDHDLRNALVFCRIESWLTGRRLVSLPFSDHCEPLLQSGDEAQMFAEVLEEEARQEHRWYIEMRPLTSFEIKTSLRCSHVNYSFHHLDLAPELEVLFQNFHKDSIQRKIRRAEREHLSYEDGRTAEFLDRFYRLFKMTRQRHRLPPPPKTWFRNLVECFGGALKIRLAAKQGRTVAAMLTLQHKDTLVYKYGCSDPGLNRFGGMHLLFWNAIQEAKQAGLSTFDFGRTDSGQSGLITFKNRWGAKESPLTYSRYSVLGHPTHVFDLPVDSWKSRAAKRTLAHLPLAVLSAVGSVLYKHVG